MGIGLDRIGKSLIRIGWVRPGYVGIGWKKVEIGFESWGIDMGRDRIGWNILG